MNQKLMRPECPVPTLFKHTINFLRDHSISKQLVNCKFIDCDSKEDILNSGLCIFHDENYLREKDRREQNEQNVRTKLMDKVREKDYKKEPLVCIGYYLPSIRLVNKIFTNPVNFSKCKFQGEADFSDTTFSRQADFRQAEFSERTSFYSAEFSGKETYFNKAEFSGKETYFNKAEFSKGSTYFDSAEFSGKETYFNRTEFSGERTSFNAAKFSGGRTSFCKAKFSGGRTSFDGAKFSGQADFTRSDFKEEVTFDGTIFPSPEESDETSAKPTKEQDKSIPIIFDYCKFRKTVQFNSKSEKEKPLELGLVSFKEVDLSNVVFNNVKWQEIRDWFRIPRNIIVDEKMLGINRNYRNYQEVSKIYNQLRKNYESKLLFNEASNFFIGEMEAIRKKLLNGTASQKLASVPYSLYKGLAFYGESCYEANEKPILFR